MTACLLSLLNLKWLKIVVIGAATLAPITDQLISYKYSETLA